MTDLGIVASFPLLLQVFSPCFNSPTFDSFVTLMSGWVLNVGRHTVTGTVRAAGAVGLKHISSYHRFFSKGWWIVDDVGLTLARLIVSTLIKKDAPIVLIVDDTLGRHTGKNIAAASMHRDPLLSTAKRARFHWGHVWVVMAIEVERFGRRWALPVLMRLHRTKKRCEAEGRTYRKTTEQARSLMMRLADAFPKRQFRLLGDAAYTNGSLIKGQASNVTIFGRGRLDAALYEPAPKRKGAKRGRPRVRGKRIASPQKQARDNAQRFERVVVHVYGKTCTVDVLVIDALWYQAAHSELIRMVLVRGFPGHERDDVFVCTDTSICAREIIQTYACRWALDVTFHEAKGKLGFEHPQNRGDKAVERTAPMALFAYSLVVVWYAKTGHRTRYAQSKPLPWYTNKPAVTFTDMLATIRRASWAQRILDPHASAPDLRKRILPLLEYISAAA